MDSFMRWCNDLVRGIEKLQHYRSALLTLFLTTLAVLWLSNRRMAKNSSKPIPPLPPGPSGLPLVGYLPFLANDLHQQFSDLATLYGPIYKLFLGKKLCVVISSPSLVKEVVRDHDTVFANRDVGIATLAATSGGKDMGFMPYSPEWKKLRKIFAQKMLSNTILDSLYCLRREEVHKSIRQIYGKIGCQIDIGSLSFLTVINSVMHMSCGESLRGENIDGANYYKLSKTSAELMVLIAKPNVSDFFPSIAWLDLQGIERQTKKIIRMFDTLFESAIERHKKVNIGELKSGTSNEEIRKDFLQFLLELHENGDDATSISMDQLKALLLDILIGGTDTTATTIEWTMAELLYHPEVMNKVNQELTQVVGLNNMVEESHLSQLTYLNAVIKETFRLHPPIPFLVPRCPSQSATIGGYNVPKGAKIFLNIRAIHRDPNIWENPSEFKPERFLIKNNNEKKRFDFSGNDFQYLPFGSGRRICAGLPLAERMLIYVLASFLHSFEWRLPPGAKLEFSDKFGIVLKKLEPLVAIPTPRLANLELYS